MQEKSQKFLKKKKIVVIITVYLYLTRTTPNFNQLSTLSSYVIDKNFEEVEQF